MVKKKIETSDKQPITISLDISKVEIKDLNGNTVRLADNLGKTLGNELYFTLPSLGWLPIAQDFNAGKTVTLDEDMANSLISIVQSPKIAISMGVKQSIVGHIYELLESAKK